MADGLAHPGVIALPLRDGPHVRTRPSGIPTPTTRSSTPFSTSPPPGRTTAGEPVAGPTAQTPAASTVRASTIAPWSTDIQGGLSPWIWRKPSSPTASPDAQPSATFVSSRPAPPAFRPPTACPDRRLIGSRCPTTTRSRRTATMRAGRAAGIPGEVPRRTAALRVATTSVARGSAVATQTPRMTLEGPDESVPGDDVEHDTKGGGLNVCPDCCGTGRVGAELCGSCGGTGRLEETVA